jgi:hypothetical protein
MMARCFILDSTNQPVAVDFIEWARWFEGDPDRRRVRLSAAIPGVMVSTVFLGIDHRFSGEGPPIIFETMAFGLDDSAVERAGMRRYASWYEAVIGHEEIVDDLKDWHERGRP